jgi:hypothetical protein
MFYKFNSGITLKIGQIHPIGTDFIEFTIIEEDCPIKDTKIAVSQSDFKKNHRKPLPILTAEEAFDKYCT